MVALVTCALLAFVAFTTLSLARWEPTCFTRTGCRWSGQVPQVTSSSSRSWSRRCWCSTCSHERSKSHLSLYRKHVEQRLRALMGRRRGSALHTQQWVTVASVCTKAADPARDRPLQQWRYCRIPWSAGQASSPRHLISTERTRLRSFLTPSLRLASTLEVALVRRVL